MAITLPFKMSFHQEYDDAISICTQKGSTISCIIDGIIGLSDAIIGVGINGAIEALTSLIETTMAVRE